MFKIHVCFFFFSFKSDSRFYWNYPGYGSFYPIVYHPQVKKLKKKRLLKFECLLRALFVNEFFVGVWVMGLKNAKCNIG